MSLYVTPRIAIPDHELEESFIRSSGPGGQNVNKVASAVQLRFDVRNSASLTELARSTLLLGGGLTRDGVLVITAQRFREQERNRADARAVREMVAAIQSGASVGISPDGPRGPRMRAHTGMTMVAKLTGARIVPMSFSSARGRVLHSWDRFLIGYPFARGVFICGEPVTVPADADEAALEAARATLEARLNEVTAEADRLCGRVLVEPAPVAAEA